jgi:hypothetical protein
LGDLIVRFTLFTDKTVAQCNSAINERLQAPATSSRPGLEGWVEKSGKFSLAMTTAVMGRFTRTTRLEAQVERESGQTVIRGTVADGVGPQGQIVILLGMVLVSIMLFVQGQTVLGIIALIAGFVLYMSFRGDYENSDRLLMEVEKTLKATPKPPKGKPSGAIRTVAAKPSTARTTAVKKPAGGKSTAAKKPSGAKSTTTSRSTAAKKPTPSARPAVAAAGKR